jgi:hypothetical protein
MKDKYFILKVCAEGRADEGDKRADKRKGGCRDYFVRNTLPLPC